MPVISLVSPKGGVGKTTVALTLAGAFADSGAPVTLIDADPNAPLVAWAQRPRRPELISVVEDQSEDTIQANIEDALKSSKLVIVDLEGTANLRVSYAVAASDLVLIPCKGSILDANEAAKAIKLVRKTSAMLKRPIDFALVFSQIPAALKPRNLRDLEQQFAEHAIPVCPVSMIEREAFRTLFSTGGTLYTLGSTDVAGVEKARHNGFELAQWVVSRLRSKAPSHPSPSEVPNVVP